MANPNTTEEERQPLQKPGDYVPATYTPPTPTAAYEGSDQAALMQQMINDWAAKTDPRMQAEQDAKIQRGRQFWTGANLFANVVANAINAGGTAKGAPNMTWNDNASQKMYDTWRDKDKELKADRKAAQQRLDALRLQDAQFRMADAQARDKAALDAYNRNYEAGEKANQINYGTQVKEYERGIAEQQRQQQRQEGMEDYEQKLKLQNKYRPNTGGSTKEKDETKYHIPIGHLTIKANNSWEQRAALRKIAKELEKYSGGATVEDGKEYTFILDHFDDIYASNEDFRTWVDNAYGEKPETPKQPQRRITYPTVEKNGFGMMPQGMNKPQGNAGKVKFNFG